MNFAPFEPGSTKDVKRVFATTSRTREVATWLFCTTLALLLVVATADLIVRLLTLPDVSDPVVLLPNEFDPTAEATLFHLRDGPQTTCEGTMPQGASVAAFIPADDATARSALLAHCAELDRVILEAMAFGVEAGAVISLASEGWTAEVAALGRPSFFNVKAQFNGPDGGKAALLTDPNARARFLRNVQAKWPSGVGLCLDLSGNSAVSPIEVRDLLVALRPLARARSAALCVVGTIDAAFLLDESVVSSADLIVAKGFREPGRMHVALAPQAWFDAAISPLVAKVPREKLLLVLGTFGLQTEAATGRAEQVAFATAMARTREAGGSTSVDSATLNTNLEFEGIDGHTSKIVVLDGLSFANQLSVLPPEVALAVWPLGYEDPAVWSLLAGEHPEAALERPIVLSNQVLLIGTGPVALRVKSEVDGIREMQIDRLNNRMVGQIYSRLPSPNIMSRSDGALTDAVLIVFDGLPPPEQMSTILQQLAQHRVRSAFSVTASDIIDKGHEVRSVVAAGHAIVLAESGDLAGSGLHADMSRLRDRVAMMALAGETSRRTILAETWGRGEILPSSSGEFATLIALQKQGRIRLPLGERVPLKAEQASAFAERVLSSVYLEGTQLVRFDTSEAALQSTLITLPMILSAFKKAGARFISPDDLAGPADSLAMREAHGGSNLRDKAYLWIILKADRVLAATFFVLLAIAIARSTTFLILALLRTPRDTRDPNWEPPVTIVIPAYNESKVIEACIRSTFACNYPDLRVIVVDDGSQDGTSAVVASIGANDRRVSLLRQKNSGKWAAANLALRHVQTSYFIILDADSVLETDAIRWIVQPFINPDVGAVSGIVEVGNALNWLTACQKLEYLVSQNIHRRAHETYSGIFVVPGAIGAWNTHAVMAAGMFSGETITEDADLTLAVHRAGYRVVMAENARAFTEAPETLAAFLSQRVRWTLGMLQTSWKHRMAIVEGRPVGYISIVDAVWFSVLTTILSPIVDLTILVLAGSLIFAVVMDLPVGGTSFGLLLPGLLGLTLLDLLNTLAMMHFEKRFSIRLLLLTPVLRFGYRQLLYFATLRATWRAITGKLTDWNKLERSGALKVKPQIKPRAAALELMPT